MSARSGERAVYYPLFDYLRAALSVGVFADHADADRYVPPNFGNFCVQAFFALSGFLIGSILARTRLEDLPRFYFNRTTRIWVPYALAIALLFAGCLAKRQPLDSKLAEFFFYKITFVYNWFGPPQLTQFPQQVPLQGTGNHFWSICVEEQFYLLAPFLIVPIKRFRAVAVCLVLIGLLLLNRWEFTSISLGVLLALSHERFGSWFLSRWVALGLALVLPVTLWLTHTALVPYSMTAPVAAACIVALLARPGSASGFGRLVGGVSYPFYLNHWVGLVFIRSLERLLGVPMIAVAIAFVIAAALSTVHYLLIDRQVMQRRNGWYSPFVGRMCCVVGFGLVTSGLIGAALVD